MNISEMDTRISVIEWTNNTFKKSIVKRVWAKVEATKQRVAATSHVTKTRGISITMRANPINFGNLIEYNAHMYTINNIQKVDRFYIKITAAECTYKEITVYAPKENFTFSGAIFEKWQGYQTNDPMYIAEERLVAVVPKAVELAINDVISFGNKKYIVESSHEIDEYRNEYEVYRKEEL